MRDRRYGWAKRQRERYCHPDRVKREQPPCPEESEPCPITGFRSGCTPEFMGYQRAEDCGCCVYLWKHQCDGGENWDEIESYCPEHKPAPSLSVEEVLEEAAKGAI